MIFKNAWFKRFAKREEISNETLRETIDRAERGLIDADFGGNVIKQRIARPNEGKSGGYRTIIIFKKVDKAFFVYGFAKNERDNIRKDEKEAFKEAAKELLALSDEQIQKLIKTGGLIEVES